MFAPTANSQTPAETPTETPSPKSPTQIVFVPENLFSKGKEGKFKENTFYWSNLTGDTKSGPTPMEEEENSFLRIAGPTNIENIENKNTASKEARTHVARTYLVPDGATSATIQIKIRWTYDPWADPIRNGSKPKSRLSFLNNGKSFGKPLNTFSAENKNAGWVTTSQTFEIVPKTQQILIELTSRTYVPVDIAAMDVIFK